MKNSEIKIKENQKYSGISLESYLEEKERLEEENKVLTNQKVSLIDQAEILEFWKDGFSSTGIPSLLIAII